MTPFAIRVKPGNANAPLHLKKVRRFAMNTGMGGNNVRVAQLLVYRIVPATMAVAKMVVGTLVEVAEEHARMAHALMISTCSGNLVSFSSIGVV